MGAQTIKRGGDSVKRAQPTKTKDKHFLDNDKFKEDIREYQQACLQAEAEGKPIPQIPNKLGDAFFKIATALSKKHYFISYSWNDDSIMDSVLKCCAAVRKFNTEAGTSAFAYFQQISYYEFVDRIKAEKKEKLAKAAIVQNLGVLVSDMSLQDVDHDEDFQNSMSEILALQSVEIDWKTRPQKAKPVKEVEVDLFDIDAAIPSSEEL